MHRGWVLIPGHKTYASPQRNELGLQPLQNPELGWSFKATADQACLLRPRLSQDSGARARLRWGAWRRRKASCGSFLFGPVQIPRDSEVLAVFASAPKGMAGVKPFQGRPPPPGEGCAQPGFSLPTPRGLQPPLRQPRTPGWVADAQAPDWDTHTHFWTSIRLQTPLNGVPEITTVSNNKPPNRLSWPFGTPLHTPLMLPWWRLDLYDFLYEGKSKQKDVTPNPATGRPWRGAAGAWQGAWDRAGGGGGGRYSQQA